MKLFGVVFLTLCIGFMAASIMAEVCVKKDANTVTCTEAVDHDKATIERVVKDFDNQIAQIDAARIRLLAERQPWVDRLADLNK